MRDFDAQFRAARRASVPLSVVKTLDQQACMRRLCASVNPKAPKIAWNCMEGFVPLDKYGAACLDQVMGEEDTPASFVNPVAALEKAADFANVPMQVRDERGNVEETIPRGGALVVFQNLHRLMDPQQPGADDAPQIIQGISNIRDRYAGRKSMLSLLSPSIVLPPELAPDVLVLDEPLPNADQLREIILKQYKGAKLTPSDDDIIARAVDAVRGLTAFAAAQCAAMSFETGGTDINLDLLWERKRQVISETPGLSVWRGGERFDDLGGLANLKNWLRTVLTGRKKPRLIVFIDEIEKALAGSTGGDNTGVSQRLLGMLLSYMQDTESKGTMLVGPPGTAKSAIAKAMGAEAGIPTITLEMARMFGSLLGTSEERLTTALKICTALSEGSVYFIATCNNVTVLPPELKRAGRFTHTFFVDAPQPPEQKDIFKIYMKKYGIEDKKLPAHDQWTGAEIKECVFQAWNYGITLEESSKFIVPVAQAMGAKLAQLRQEAHQKYLSAAYEGTYVYEEKALKKPSYPLDKELERRINDERLN